MADLSITAANVIAASDASVQSGEDVISGVLFSKLPAPIAADALIASFRRNGL